MASVGTSVQQLHVRELWGGGAKLAGNASMMMAVVEAMHF